MKIYKVEDFDKPFYMQDFIGEEHLIIAMSGYGQDFEWFRTMKKYGVDLPFNKLWLRDLKASYWHGIFPGVGVGPFEFAEFIKEKIEESKSKKVLMMGLSMGGYGATLFGCLCNVDLVLSFSGQSHLPKFRRDKYNLDEKWNGLNVDRKYTDLKNIFKEYNSNNKTAYKLFFGKENKTDRSHVERLESERGVKLYPIDTNSHNSTGPALKSGLAGKIIRGFLKSKYHRWSWLNKTSL